METEPGKQTNVDDAAERRTVEPLAPEAVPHEFADLMKLEIVTPCAEGLALLKAFQEKSPGLFALAERDNFIDLKHPGFKTNRLWLAFSQHYAGCGHCNGG